MGSELAADFAGLDWDALLAIQRRLGWDDLSSNLLLVGQMGNTTPAHYDEQQNLFAQLGACDCPRALPWCHACHRRQRPARAAWSSSRPVARDLLHMDHCPCLPDADGRKRVVLFRRRILARSTPFLVHHLCDRQSQVDLYAPDLTRFPRFPKRGSPCRRSLSRASCSTFRSTGGTTSRTSAMSACRSTFGSRTRASLRK